MLPTDTSLQPQRSILLGVSKCIEALRVDAESAARSDAKVLLTGETGVGKEVVAHTIHQQSRRAKEPFITINCAGVPDTLLESEFFGHARGSFTGAFRDSPGMLRQADGGTVFLDEVGEMSLRMQALFLRFLETGEIQTVGGGAIRSHIDVRIITATNRNLLESIADREFREDLYYRLNVFHMHIAPLRERKADISLLLEHYSQVFASQYHKPTPVLSAPALNLLIGYAWPGNVRELRNVIERVVSRMVTPVIEPAHLPPEVLAGAGRVIDDVSGRFGTAVSHKARVDAILERILVNKESFWTTAYPAFMARDMTRDDMRHIIRAGLEQTHGSYRVLLGVFNLAASDYKRLLGFLKQHDCHLPFQRFRTLKAVPRDTQRAGGAGA